MDLAEVARLLPINWVLQTLNQSKRKLLRVFLEGNDVFAVLPTGYGKSLCYTCLPVAFDLMNETKGLIVVVITPLTAIMKDQVKRK